MKSALLLLALIGAASATELTPANWDSAVAGKTVLIKFQALWRGHCKSMKPAWDKLMAEFDGHASALVGDVDCTAAGKPLCYSNGVRGFPTIKYGDPNNIDICDATQKAEIEKFQTMSADELTAAIAGKDKEGVDAEALFKSEVEKLQKTYEQLQKDKETTLEEIKKSGLGIMKAVKAAGAAGKDEV